MVAADSHTAEKFFDAIRASAVEAVSLLCLMHASRCVPPLPTKVYSLGLSFRRDERKMLPGSFLIEPLQRALHR